MIGQNLVIMKQEIIDLTEEEHSENENTNFKIKELDNTCTKNFLDLTKKLNYINEKLYFFNESVESLYSKYQNFFPAFVTDKNNRLLYGNGLFLEEMKIYGFYPNQILFKHTKCFLEKMQENNESMNKLLLELSRLTKTKTKFTYYVEQKHFFTGKYIAATICVNKIMNPFKDILIETIYLVKPLTK
jgi:hypothetical protein